MRYQTLKAIGLGLESMALTDTEILLSSKSLSNMEDMEKSARTTGAFRTGTSIKIQSISSLKIKDEGNNIDLQYFEDSGKQQKLSITLDDAVTAKNVADELIHQLDFEKKDELENKIKPLLVNLFIIIVLSIVAAGFAFIVDGEGFGEDENQSGRKNKLGRTVMKFIVETVGTKGVALLIIPIIAYFIYDAVKRYKNPKLVNIYTRKPVNG